MLAIIKLAFDMVLLWLKTKQNIIQLLENYCCCKSSSNQTLIPPSRHPKTVITEVNTLLYFRELIAAGGNGDLVIPLKGFKLFVEGISKEVPELDIQVHIFFLYTKVTRCVFSCS